MRILMLAAIAGAALLSACGQSVDFDPNDPAVIAAIDSIVAEAMKAPATWTLIGCSPWPRVRAN